MSDMKVRLRLQAKDDGLKATVKDAAQSVDELSQSSEKLDKETKQATNSQDKFGDSAKKSGKKVKDASESSAQASKSTADFSSKLKGGAVTAGVWAAATVAAGVAAAGMVAIVRTDAIREINNLSDTLNVSTASLTEWQYAAGQMGLESDKVGDIFKDVSDKVGDFVTTGGGEAADIFENLNVQVKELQNLSPDEQLLKIAGALDDVNRNQQIFFLESIADDASRLLPLLDNGAQRLIAMRREAQVLGVSISDIDADMVSQAAGEMSRLKALGEGTANSLAIEFAPILSAVSGGIVDWVVQAGGFRNAIAWAVDGSVSAIGFLLDYGRMVEIWLTGITSYALQFATYATEGMDAYADAISSVINTALYPFQQAYSYVFDGLATAMRRVSSLVGPFSDEFEAAADMLDAASIKVRDFRVEAEDVAQVNDAIAASYQTVSDRLAELLDSEDPSVQLKENLADLRSEMEETAKANQALKASQASDTASKATIDANQKIIDSLREELELLGMTERERAIARQTSQLDINDKIALTDSVKAQIIEVEVLAGKIYDLGEAQKAAAKEQEDFKKQLDDANTAAQRFLQDGNLGEIEGLESIQEQLQDAMSVKGITADMEADFSEAIDKIQGRIKDLKFNNMVDGISSGISSLQTLTEKGSDSYQKMEVALAALNLAQATYAVLNQASGDPYTAFPRMATMITAVGQLGVALNGIGSGDVAAQRQASQGTGGVLGDATAKSESILKSNELIAEAAEEIVGINRSMLDALLSLEVSINGAALQITRKWDDSVDAPASTEIGWLPPSAAISSVISDVLGMTDLGAVVADLWGASVKGKDSGLVLEASNLGNLSAQSYMTWEERKNWLDDYDTKWKFTELDSQITQQLRLVMGGIADSVSAGADQLGMSGDAIDQAIQSFALERTLISLKDLTADEQQEELQAVFSSVFDDLSGHVMPWLVEFQQAGEGLGETLSRLATEASAVENVVGMLGLTFSDVDDQLRAKTNLVSAMGGLEEFVSAYSAFSDKFLSEEQQFTNARDQLQSAFAQYDAILPATREDYLALVQAQDAATDAGAKNIAKLFELSSAADEYYSMLEDREDDRLAVAQQRSGLMRQLYELEGDSEAALKLTREAELSALDESNRELQQRIYLLQDEADLADTIRANVSNAFNQLSQSISAEINTLSKNWADRQQYLNDEIQVVSDSTSALKTFIEALRNTQNQLNETTQLDFINAQRTAFGWLDSMRSGSWTEPTDYQDTLAQLSGLNADWYASEVDYERDRKLTSNALAEAQKLAGNQLSVEDETLLTLQDTLALEKRAYDNAVEDLEAQREFWQKELNAINGVDDSILSVAEAIERLKEVMEKAWSFLGDGIETFLSWLKENQGGQLTVNDIVLAIERAGLTNRQVADAMQLMPEDRYTGSDDSITAWLNANPNASDDMIAAAMRIYGVTIERIAELTGLSITQATERYLATIPDQVVDQVGLPNDAAHGDDEVRLWLQQNGGATLKQVAKAMDQFGVTIEQMARASGWSVQDVEAAYLGLSGSQGQSTNDVYVDGRQSQSSNTSQQQPVYHYPSDGGHSDDEVYQWLASNSTSTLEQYAAAMDQYGVTIEQMARVSGWSVADVRAAYQSVNGSHANGLDNVPFDGYIAQLHKGEMVLPAGQSDYLRNGETAKQFKALKDEIITLRKSNSALLAEISKSSASSAKTAKQLSKGAPVYIMNQATQQEAQ